jgi:outer membrane protein OmpA-like peptidoglycan-associated protein
MRAVFLIVVFVLFSGNSYAQTKTSINDLHNIYDEKGDYYFDKKEFKKAIVYYNMAFKLNSANFYSILKKAEAYTNLGLYDQAAECYRIIFNSSLEIPNEHRLNYALILLKNKDIKGFEKWMTKYNEIVYSEIYNYLTGTDVRAKMYKDSSFVIVENESILNTSESEISPAFINDKIIFSSTRKNLSGSYGSNNYNLFSASYMDAGQLGRLNFFNKSLNSTQNEKSIFYSGLNKKLYVTRSASGNTQMKTLVSGLPGRLDEMVSVSELQVEGVTNPGQVVINNKGNKLYFVSDIPGGFGGLDIYLSELVGGKWTKPKNLGSVVNSNKDESYPFIVNDSILYFSSAGHNSLGGIDLYVVNLNAKNASAKNLGTKVNSAYDDYSLSFSSDGLTGYFCSNRPGGFGKEDIYRLHLLELKVKLPAYKFKKKTSIESDKINLYLNNGDEYNIASKDKSGFNFGFLPTEPYKIIIQHENPLASNIIYNEKLTTDEKEKEFLYPQPLQKSEIKLQAGMKYQFTAGMKPITADFKQALKDLSVNYLNTGNTIDLTALAKELQLNEGEIYSIRFVKDDAIYSDTKSAKESSLFVNDQIIDVSSETFFFILPLDIQANFNIETDIAYLKENFNPKKVGSLTVDAEPVYKEEPVKFSAGFPILVNTESFSDIASGKQVTAKELTIIPGTMYILTFGKANTNSEESGVFVPLTKGVKYNLGTETQSVSDYNKALMQMSATQSQNKADEELIDISVLSKELEVSSEKDIVFNLIPARQIATQAGDAGNVLTTLSVDGRKFYVTNRVKMQINLKLERNKTVNIQTDLAYVKENFEPAIISLKLDTTSFNSDIARKTKPVITDPVFDVITVNYNLNDYSIRPDAKSIIAEKVIEVLRNDSRFYVTIKGYTDPIGNTEYNDKLSMNRAQTVRDFLTNNGIVESRIRTFSYGETMSLKAGTDWKDLSETELEKYRKVEIVIYLPK